MDAETKAVRCPILLANSFELNDTSETLPESFDWSNPNAFNYPRSRHPNARYLEERLAGMEGGEDCGVSASGVAAISGAFFTLLSAGDHLISSRICSIGIHGFLVEHFAKRFGVELTLVDTTSPAEGQAAARPNTKLIHVETPAIPTTRVSDFAVSAKQIGAILTVDSTFSGLVMPSLTKYVGGVLGSATGHQARSSTFPALAGSSQSRCVVAMSFCAAAGRAARREPRRSRSSSPKMSSSRSTGGVEKWRSNRCAEPSRSARARVRC